MSTQTGSLDLKAAKGAADQAIAAKIDATAAQNAAKTDVNLYGTCSTAAGTATKEIALQTETGRVAPTALRAGMTILVSFTDANTNTGAINLSITVNGTSIGSAGIYASGAVVSSTNQMLWGAGAKIQFTYNGTYWVPIGHPCTYYGTSSTAAATAAKVTSDVGNGECVICKGTTIGIKFTYANSASAPTINVNSIGAKDVYTQNETSAYWSAGATVQVTFDGQCWRVSSEPIYASQAIIGNAARGHVYIDDDELAMYTQSATPAVYINTTAQFSSPWFFIYTAALASLEAFSAVLQKQSDGTFDQSVSIVVLDDAGEYLEYAWGSGTPYILSEDDEVVSGKTYYEWSISGGVGSFSSVTPSSGDVPYDEGWYEVATTQAAGSTATGHAAFSVAYDGDHTITWTNKKSSANANVNCYAVYYVHAPAPYMSIGKRDWPNPDYVSPGPGALSFTCGQWLLAEGRNAVVFGQLSSAGGNNAFTSGADNQVDGYASMAFGLGLRVPVANQVAVGSYNEIDPRYDPQDPNASDNFGAYAFVVGIGENEASRHNGFWVDWGGVACTILTLNGSGTQQDPFYYTGGFCDEGLMLKTTRNKWHVILGEEEET